MLQIGDKAPDFSLPDQEGTEHSLTDYQGKWVLLYFYPKDNTPGCTTEACAIRDVWDEYKEHNVVVLGVSKDSVESHQKFVADHALPFTLLADTDKKVLKAYGALRGAFTRRISYMVSPHGTIAAVYTKVDPATHAMDVLRELETVSELA